MVLRHKDWPAWVINRQVGRLTFASASCLRSGIRPAQRERPGVSRNSPGCDQPDSIGKWVLDFAIAYNGGGSQRWRGSDQHRGPGGDAQKQLHGKTPEHRCKRHTGAMARVHWATGFRLTVVEGEALERTSSERRCSRLNARYRRPVADQNHLPLRWQVRCCNDDEPAHDISHRHRWNRSRARLCLHDQHEHPAS